MNPETFKTIALSVGFIACGLIVVAAFLGAYLLIYEMIKVALRRIFLPLWFAHLITVAIRLRCYRPEKGMKPEDCRRLVVRFIFAEVRLLEDEFPEMRGLLKELLR